MADFFQNIYSTIFPERKETESNITKCDSSYSGNKDQVVKRAREYVKNRKDDILEIEVNKSNAGEGSINPCFISNTMKCIETMKKEGIYDKKTDSSFDDVLRKLNNTYSIKKTPQIEACYRVFNEQSVRDIFEGLDFKDFSDIMEGRPDMLKRYAKQGLAITSLALMANAALAPVSKKRLEKRLEKKETKKLVEKVAEGIKTKNKPRSKKKDV